MVEEGSSWNDEPDTISIHCTDADGSSRSEEQWYDDEDFLNPVTYHNLCSTSPEGNTFCENCIETDGLLEDSHECNYEGENLQNVELKPIEIYY